MYQQAVRACWKSDDIKATAMRSGICRRIQELMKRTECLVSVLFFLFSLQRNRINGYLIGIRSTSQLVKSHRERFYLRNSERINAAVLL